MESSEILRQVKNNLHWRSAKMDEQDIRAEIWAIQLLGKASALVY